MKTSDVIVLASETNLNILEMSRFAQFFFGCVLTTIRVGSKEMYVKEEDGSLLMAYEEDDRLHVMATITRTTDSETLAYLLGMPDDPAMSDSIPNTDKYSLFRIHDELVHCFMFDHKKHRQTDHIYIYLKLVCDPNIVPGLAEKLLEDCTAAGVFAD